MWGLFLNIWSCETMEVFDVIRGWKPDYFTSHTANYAWLALIRRRIRACCILLRDLIWMNRVAADWRRRVNYFVCNIHLKVGVRLPSMYNSFCDYFNLLWEPLHELQLAFIFYFHRTRLSTLKVIIYYIVLPLSLARHLVNVSLGRAHRCRRRGGCGTPSLRHQWACPGS